MKLTFLILTICFSVSCFASLSCSELMNINPKVLKKISDSNEAFAEKLSNSIIEEANYLASWGISDMDEDVLHIHADAMIVDESLSLLNQQIDCMNKKLDDKK